jgi:PPOX class probable F420-dependent enzyme
VDLSNLDPWALELVREARVAHLGLIDGDGRPRVLPVTFAPAEGAVYSAIDRKPKRTAEPARLRWLRERPEAALTVDLYDDDWSKLAWVQLLGRISLEEVDSRPDAVAELRAKYPRYIDEPPPGPLLRFEPARAVCWRAAGG